MRLIKSEIDLLTCPPDRKDLLVFDDALPGFGLRITASGQKVFLFQYRWGARVRRIRLGRYGDLTPAQARRLAEKARGDVAAGNDPMGERQAKIAAENDAREAREAEAEADAFTFARLVDEWAREKLSLRSLSYQREALRALRVSLGELLPLPARKVDAAMLRAALGKITSTTPRAIGITARGPVPERGRPGTTIQKRVRAYVHAMFAWAVANGLAESNPAATVRIEGRSAPRERVLTDAELGEAWRAAGKIGWPWGPFFRLLMLTLQRKAEVAGMRWSEISVDGTRWEIPGARTKNRKPHIVYLVPQAREILAGLPRLTIPPGHTPSPYVFTTTGRVPIQDFSHAKDKIDRLILQERMERAQATRELPAPLEPWRNHDLRRTGTTVMVRMRVRWEVADRILNHVGSVISGVKAVYQLYDFLDERQAALEKWAEHLEGCAKIGDPCIRVTGGELSTKR